ncbi:MAG: 16S rRNA (adenine(1518)-N(6)/adenine(1519)-N(6))-dimethyltransferase [Legionella sp. 40-6]|nr:MAG: 16S rRNA (adenine(1518)-N(6)/adenine(1519)-N(6))-dimethyltransferase [Legionella sp. 40-6]
MKHRPRKRFGQNFLHDARIIQQIIAAVSPQASDNLLEIGPGLGALTHPLLRIVRELTVIEIDRDLQQYWSQAPNAQHLTLIPQDALTVDYGDFGADLRIIGNLPYNISTPLLLLLMRFCPMIRDMHFMLQKEVVERMAAMPGNKDYGRLTIMLQYHCEITHLFDVAPDAFDPPPKVDSAIIRLVPYQHNPYDPIDQESLEFIVGRAFAMRRKTLNNNLKGLITPAELEQLGINGQKRPEQLSIEDYVQLAKFISK